MKLTKLSAALLHGRLAWPVGRCRLVPAQAGVDAGTASQLIAGVRRTVRSLWQQWRAREVRASILAFWDRLLTAVRSDGCGNGCDFGERCEGNTRQMCATGVRHGLGRRIREDLGDAERSACVVVGASVFGVGAPSTRCDAHQTAL